MTCSRCGTENDAERRFCRECGAQLALACAACGAPNAPGDKFCGSCGAALAPQVQPKAAASPPQAERRLVSVLFADLVGFTAASEDRDAEETRELLSRYFEQAKTLIERYGGTVEKFIGDAVMAVWGTPVAQEDDAERTVRAALDLVAAVPELHPALQARAGVLTGEAAVTIGAEGQGMVAGDLVNTASRIQSAAEAGTVLVGETTRRSTQAAIAYEHAGEHELKGKLDPVPLFRALRVTAGRGGAIKSVGLEPPFVGRDRELRLVKELFHASAEERKAQLVSVVGIAGIGKSRLGWEFFKYIDGVAEGIFWHRGRCLSYGEGVAYWALAEMVRMRCEIVEDEEPETAVQKLRATIERHVPDPQERQWIEPRLAHLLGLEEGTPGDQENLFSAWRILFERLSDESPTVLVFEDMQWADNGLLDFLEYILDWSRSHPLFVLVLARPELADRRPSWSAGKRSFTSLYLDPLSPQAMDDLLSGLVPGLPDDLRAAILDRAQGVPLYAVETVRMLLDRELLTLEGTVFRTTGPIETLEVPETLHALVAARLDGLTQEERRLVQDSAVLGKTFTTQGLAALTGLDDRTLEPILASLLRKEILAIQADPRSPERGQYAFLQDIIKRVAYETLSRRERKAKHLAAARFLESTWNADEDEIVEVVAAHYLDAYEASPEDDDADQIKERARETLVRAAERAALLSANAEAQAAFERAATLADDPLVQAKLRERAGIVAYAAGRADAAASHFESAAAIYTSAGATHAAASVSARLAEIMWDRGRLEEGLESMDRAFQGLSGEEPDEHLGALAAQLGKFRFFAGDLDTAAERIQTALEIAEALWLPETFSEALNTKAILLNARHHPKEANALLRYALRVALDHDKPSAALRAYFNLSEFLCHADHYEEGAGTAREGLALARRVGNRYWERSFLAQLYAFFSLGEWNEMLAMAFELPLEDDWSTSRLAVGTLLPVLIAVNVHRGDVDQAESLVSRLGELELSADVQERTQHACARSRVLLARDQPAEALRAARIGFDGREACGITHEAVKESLVVGVEAALASNDVAAAEELLASVEALPPGRSPQFLQAHAARFRAHLAERAGKPAEAERRFKRAAGLFREIAVPFYLAVTQLEYGEWLARDGRGGAAEPLLAEAREIFQQLGAVPWLERTARVGAQAQVPA